jgi:molybdopterin-guanine dinucleotide biosynthesis protein A
MGEPVKACGVILAGGQSSRMGTNKALLEVGGVTLIERLARQFSALFDQVVVVTNTPDLYTFLDLPMTGDRIPGLGPLGGLDVLAAACATPWLLTVPVDLVGVNECLVPTLIASAGDSGSFAQDDDGLQPLVALWRVEKLRRAVPQALEAGEYAMQALQERMDMACVRFTGVRFGNLNTPADLVAAGIATS